MSAEFSCGHLENAMAPKTCFSVSFLSNARSSKSWIKNIIIIIYILSWMSLTSSGTRGFRFFSSIERPVVVDQLSLALSSLKLKEGWTRSDSSNASYIQSGDHSDIKNAAGPGHSAGIGASNA